MREEVENLPVYQKVMTILDITQRITDLVNAEDKPMLHSTAEFMLSDAL